MSSSDVGVAQWKSEDERGVEGTRMKSLTAFYLASSLRPVMETWSSRPTDVAFALILAPPPSTGVSPPGPARPGPVRPGPRQ